MKQELKYERRGTTIIDKTTGEITQFDSRNKAKAESRRLQQANGGLGQGSLQVNQRGKKR